MDAAWPESKTRGQAFHKSCQKHYGPQVTRTAIARGVATAQAARVPAPSVPVEHSPEQARHGISTWPETEGDQVLAKHSKVCSKGSLLAIRFMYSEQQRAAIQRDSRRAIRNRSDRLSAVSAASSTIVIDQFASVAIASARLSRPLPRAPTKINARSESRCSTFHCRS